MFYAWFNDNGKKFSIECSYFENKNKPQNTNLTSVEEAKEQYKDNALYIGLEIR